jgi:hypothetical protein
VTVKINGMGRALFAWNATPKLLAEVKRRSFSLPNWRWTLNWIDRLLKILEKLPGILAIFGAGFKAGSDKVREKDRELNQTKLEKELLENEIKTKNEFDSMSDDDVIRNQISNGGLAGRNSGSNEDHWISSWANADLLQRWRKARNRRDS